MKSYSHSIRMICAAAPDDFIGEDSDIMHEINEKTPDEIAKMEDDEVTYLRERWSEILQVPEDNPLAGLKDWILGFRAFADIVEEVEEELKKFIPIADWMCAGPLCIDTEKSKSNIDIDDPNTWQIRWFDHEEFDWNEEGYIDGDGKVVGIPFFPDFETFIRLYFYGIYDKLYDRQMTEEGEDLPDKTSWCS